MGRYLKKIAEAVLSLWALMTATFFLLRLLPGGPFDEEQVLQKTIYDRLNSTWGLDRPLIEQYFYYMQSILRGELGFSYFQPDSSVGSLLIQAVSRTLVMNILALVLIVFGSFFLSWILVRWKDLKEISYLNQVVILMGSLPALFLGPLLIYFFSYSLNLLPLAFLTSPSSYILPVLTLSLRPLSQLTRLIKTSWLDALRETFIRTARAKGLDQNAVLWRHGLRFSLSPLMGWMPSLVLGIFSGSIFVELLFSIPGLGSLFIESMNQRDYPVILGATFFYGLITVIFTFISEIFRLRLDPRGAT